jgi:L-alanine-DL-glutamate epimerase-like enolase superfamily enzyme
VWPPEDYTGLARVRAATETPIALGENESTLFGFREIVERGAADILQPSITKVGGISEFRKIAALAQAANVPIAPHSFYFGPGLAATLHAAASIGGELPVEFPTGELETPFLTHPLEARGGWVEVPRGPGLGVEVNEEAIRRYPYTSAGAKPFVLQ